MKTTSDILKKAETKIISPKEAEKDVEITMDEIMVKRTNNSTTNEVSEEEIKAALDILNPDEGSMESRG